MAPTGLIFSVRAKSGALPRLRLAVVTRLVLAAWLASSGCAKLRHENTAAVVDRPGKAHHEHQVIRVLESCYFFPVQDGLEPLWLPRRPDPDAAWDVDSDGSVSDGSFYTNRPIGSLSPEVLACGPCTEPPKPPFAFRGFRRRGLRPTFFGTDASGRRFLFKLDHADWPELASGAEIIVTRILWALGYHVPANYLVRIEGTGRSDLDGRRAVASLMVPGRIEGQWKLDWFRYRREMRALRVACAWLNDVDRVANNSVVAVQDERATYYLLDFDSAMGSWQGRPKPAWRGWRYVWDVHWQVRGLLSLGRARPGYDPEQPVVSRAVGRFDAQFDPVLWRPQLPNLAFRRMTDDDARWMVQKIAALSKEQLEACVAAAEFASPRDAQYILETLLARREAVLRTWPVATEGSP